MSCVCFLMEIVCALDACTLRRDLADVIELKELVVELQCTDRFVGRQQFEEGSHGGDSPWLGCHRRIGQFVVASQAYFWKRF